MNRVNYARLFSLAIVAAFASCSGGSGSTGGVKTGGDFIVLQTEPSDNGALFLNDAIRIDFSNPVDLHSASLMTFTFEVLDQVGNPVAEPVAGNFELGTSPGDAAPGRRLMFVPRLPTDDLFTNGGFRPGRTYVVQLVGGDRVNGTVLRDANGQGLKQPVSFRFTTADGATPGQLFRNPAAGGPRRVACVVQPQDATGVVLNKLGAPPVEVRLQFDQPLNPSSSNVPTALDTNPLVRSSNARGRVFLEYKDVEYDLSPDDFTWIPADVVLESNTLGGSTVLLRPLGVLPNNATVRVIVERTLEDISGESNTSNAAYDPVFHTFRTKQAYEQQFDALVDDFVSSDHFDFEVAFSEPIAEVGPGFVKAGFAFEGTTTGSEFEPQVPNTILNTNFTQVVPKVGTPYNVSGGVFNFKNVKITAGKTVQGQGSNPMIWLVSGSFEVGGILSVDGGNAAPVMSSGTANVPKPGGAGVCGGGDGGSGSPSTTARDVAGGTGNGPLQVANGGGVGGALACTAGCTRGAGGGGGSLATQGDPNYKVKTLPPSPPATVFPIFQQQTGIGGNGCGGIAGFTTRSLQGGTPGPGSFFDSRSDNNYWGQGYNVFTRLRIAGELSVPIGGGGGGGGGDLSYNSDCNINVPNFENDSSGGGGGGGGGVLVVKALGPITVLDTGRISANGGHGGGGEQSGSCSRGGGGGGGAGGMVVLMSATSININAKGTGSNFVYAAPQHDYNFSISADGGVCRTGTFGQPQIAGKYPAASGAPPAASFPNTYDQAPLGAFGGMGIVQLMAPPGTNTDNTNTILDDNIRVLRGGLELTGTSVPVSKTAMLAWRGFPNSQNQGVDDFGTVINPQNLDNEGDIRPAPTLLPTPFAEKSRLRSNWIDTGASVRRSVDFNDGFPRGIIDPAPSTLKGPRYEFAGLYYDPLNPANLRNGYIDYAISNGLTTAVYPVVVPATPISSKGSTTYLGKPAYRVALASAALGTVVDRYSQYEAELTDSGNLLVGSFRVLAHTDSELTLSAEAGALPANAANAQLRSKFFRVVTGNQEGLGGTYLGTGGARVPIANVRIGFAFHQDPANAAALRWPATANTFEYNLADPGVQESIRALGAAFVQWDILFDTKFRTLPTDAPLALSPETPRPELHFLRLPFRF